MIYYTDTVPQDLAQQLKEANYERDGAFDETYEGRLHYPQAGIYRSVPAPTFAQVFDWLLGRDVVVTVHRIGHGWESCVAGKETDYTDYAESWEDAAVAGVRKALEVLDS